MEVSKKLQPIQDATCILSEEIEGRGGELEQVVTSVEHRLEGPVNEAFIQEFTKHEALTKKQVEASQAMLEEFEAELPRSK
jgi:hypothetical protein